MNDSDDTPWGRGAPGAEFVAAEASPEFANLWKTLRRFFFR